MKHFSTTYRGSWRPATRLSDFFVPTWRDRLRYLALSGLSWCESFHSDFSRQASRVHFLLLHHLFPEEEYAFRSLVASLARDYRFIGYHEAVTRILENRIDDTYLAFSFDDGQSSCIEAAQILKEFDATGCFFVCPDLIEETNATKLNAICRQKLLHPLVEFMNWDDIETLFAQGHEIGGHTCSHANLARITLSEVRQEVNSCYERISSRLGSVRHFAWPYGQFSDFTLSSAKQVFETGFTSCASGVRGAHGASRAINPLGQHLNSPDPAGLCVYRESIVAAWPESHIRYFLNRSAKRILGGSKSWIQELAPQPVEDSCELSSTLFPSNQAAA